jgi:hypothetical protein
MVWRVWARIAGPRLPLSDVRIGRAMIGPGPKGYRPPGETVPSLSWAEEDLNFYSAVAPRMSVTSDCWIVIEGVVAADSWQAIAAVEEADVPLIVTALSAGSSENAYRVEMVGADDGADGYGISPVVATLANDKVGLTDAEIANTKARVTVLTNNRDLKTASGLLYRGLRYSDFSAGPISMAASILAFYQVIEACARLVPWVPADDYDEQRAVILATLRHQLDAKALVKKQADAVTTASNGLSRLDARFSSLRIEHAASELGLSQEWISRQRDLGKFRNSRLGHASELPSATQMSGWVANVAEPASAYALASTMLAASIEYIKIRQT